MASPATISSLEDIHERQLEVKQQLDDSKKAALQTLQTTSTEAKSVVLQDIILPVAGVAVAGYLAVKVVNHLLSEPAAETPEAAPASIQAPTNRPAAPRPQPPRARKPFYQSVLRLGTLLIPAGQAIMEVIKEERNK